MCVCIAEFLGTVIKKEFGTFIIGVDDQPPACHSARAAEHSRTRQGEQGFRFRCGWDPDDLVLIPFWYSGHGGWQLTASTLNGGGSVRFN
jgi:hypothetical protein